MCLYFLYFVNMEKSGGSRLLQMQARFQQKQMAEREMKIASLYEAQQARALGRVRQSPGSTNGVNTTASSPPTNAPVQPGKVRQMFEERRTKAGIDKSYPLQPIHNNSHSTSVSRKVNGHSKVTTKAVVKTSKSQVNVSNNIRKQKIESQVSDLNHNHVSRNGQANGYPDGVDEVDRHMNNYRIEDETFPDALAPIPTPRSPESVNPEPVRPPRRSPPTKVSSKKSTENPTPPPRRVTSENTVNSDKKGSVMQRVTKPVPKKIIGSTSIKSKPTAVAVAPSSAGNNGQPCSICGRKFAEDRLARHEDICRKTNAGKKRKPFDALKHRLVGTEAEPFINKLRKSANNPQPANRKKLNNNWRQKHEEFINAIRAAKQVQAHINAGGKLSDLPPPPPSENPDYVQCPHCNRRFNQGAAERHIPKCANYQFNKPKPNSKRR